ncbi:MAG TPA: hypothetical protein VMU59_04260 [Caulobacteraceae bacterium]|nr:hypothetical protein [Caulobacteraceae bacterium]
MGKVRRALLGTACLALATLASAAVAQGVGGVSNSGVAGAVGLQFTPQSVANTMAWDTSHAGSPAPSTAGWGHPLSDPFTDCTRIATMPSKGWDFTHAWFSYTGGSAGGTTGIIWQDQTNAHSPISCANGHLDLTVSNPTGTQWQGAQIMSEPLGPAAGGVAVQYGYFVADVVLPPPPSGMEPWPAGWNTACTTTLARTTPCVEIDGLEGLGSPTTPAMVTTGHIWPATTPTTYQVTAHHQQQFTPAQTYDGQHHVYGTLFTHDNIILYLDGFEQARMNIAAFGDDFRYPQAFLFDNDLLAFANTSQTYTMSVYKADIYTPPAGSCYVNGGC